ncbi:MAG: hypothetical protein O3A46_08860 [Candidatus Poribacteria bacterium]|nr:hypothetical protein [Candidatus Poribacteria bacterium]
MREIVHALVNLVCLVGIFACLFIVAMVFTHGWKTPDVEPSDEPTEPPLTYKPASNTARLPETPTYPTAPRDRMVGWQHRAKRETGGNG